MGPREGPDFAYVMINNLNRKTVAAMDTSFDKTEHKVRVVLKVYMSESMQCSLRKQM